MVSKLCSLKGQCEINSWQCKPLSQEGETCKARQSHAEAKLWLARYQSVRDKKEKMAALEKALSFVPKHKGTGKLCSWIKKRLSSLKRKAKKRKAPRGGESFAVRKEGAVQIVMVGAANSERSLLLSTLTNAKPEVASYPVTTQSPVPRMHMVDGVEIQLVEASAMLLPSGKPTPFLSRNLSLV